ncbi:signal peptidase I [Sporichthya sp.]|uniref:signal peptidase I n=1 Tax=Sporichthya sp. TaxID=65475 RepID=UPI0017B7EB94|nr:signal peptidase I [Sporichthya sp.]MBA3742796.1 signal peptidase I [Sporichthya sp.]
MIARTVGRLVLDVVAVALIAIALLMLSGRMAVQPVLSGSMAGYAGRGDLVVGSDTRTDSLHVGDVVLFAPPTPYETPGNHPVAHRIRSIDTVDGRLVATTKGDANAQPDPWTLDLAHTRTAQVHLVLPSAGWPFIRLHLLATPAGRMTAGLTLMASGALLLLVGRRRRRPSDEPWPPPFESDRASVPLRQDAPAGPVPEPAAVPVQPSRRCPSAEPLRSLPRHPGQRAGDVTGIGHVDPDCRQCGPTMLPGRAHAAGLVR